jgi:hypothetical protein
MWKGRLVEVFAIITLGDGLIEFLASKGLEEGGYHQGGRDRPMAISPL